MATAAGRSAVWIVVMTVTAALGEAQYWVQLALWGIWFLIEIVALVEAALGSTVMYVAHGKLTKVSWVTITVVAALLGFVSYPNPISLPGIIAIITAGVFLADVAPVVRSARRQRRRGNDGPYGPW